MKFLFISAFFKHPSTSGAAQLDRSLAIELKNQGHEIFFYSGENYTSYELKNQDNYTIQIYPLPLRKSRIDYFLPDTIEKKNTDSHFKNTLLSYKPDIIYVANIVNNVSIVEIAIQQHIPIVAICHDYSWFCLKRYLLDGNNKICSGPETFTKCYKCLIKSYGYKIQLLNEISQLQQLLFKKNSKNNLKQLTINLFDTYEKIRNHVAFLAQNSDTILFLKRNSFNYPIYKLEQPVLFDNNHIAKKSSTDTVNLVWIGRISYEKGFDVLVDNISKLITQGVINFKLTIISYQANKDKVFSYFPLKLQKYLDEKIVVINDKSTSEETLQLLIDQDLLIITSICPETGPLVLIEALSTGVPVICNNLHGNRDFLTNNQNGFIYNYQIPSELFSILKDILNQPSILDNWKNKLPELKSKKQRANEFLKIISNIQQYG